MNYETITLTAFIAILLACLGCLIAHFVGNWLWGPEDLLPPPDRACERDCFKTPEDLQ